jgi:hypothetical protein
MDTTLNKTITELKLNLTYSKSNIDDAMAKMKSMEANYRPAAA